MPASFIKGLRHFPMTDNGRVFHRILFGLLCLYYFLCGINYAHTGQLLSDDYLNSGTMCLLLYGKPYVDFSPWNNLLGHYLQMPGLLLFPDPLFGPIATRVWISLVNTAAIAGFGCLFARRFGIIPVILGLLGLIVSDAFLALSTYIRLDMFSAWCGFAALLLALGGRWRGAALACALSFMISHKGIYHFISLNIALAALFFLQPAQRRATFGLALRFNLINLFIVGGYYVFIALYMGAGVELVAHHARKLGALSDLEMLPGIFGMSLEYVFGRNLGYTLPALAGILLLACRTFCQIMRGRKAHASGLPPTQEQVADTASGITGTFYIIALTACFLLHTHKYAYFMVIIMPAFWFFSCVFFARLTDGFLSCDEKWRTRILAVLPLLACFLAGRLLPWQWWFAGYALYIGLGLTVCGILAYTGMHYLLGRYGRSRRFAENVWLLLVGAAVVCLSSINIVQHKLQRPTFYGEYDAERFFIPHLNNYLRHRRGLPPLRPESAATPEDTPQAPGEE